LYQRREYEKAVFLSGYPLDVCLFIGRLRRAGTGTGSFTRTCAPGIAIMLVVFSFNMVGDGLRDALDPRLRGTL
jgi:hypothetical protein